MKERKEIGHVKWYPLQHSIFLFFSHSTLAICSKSHHSWVVITEVFTEEILFHFWLLSAALILRYFPTGFMSFSFFHIPFFFSIICVEGLVPSNQLRFFWKQKIPVLTDGLFYRQKHPSIFSAKPLKHFSTMW